MRLEIENLTFKFEKKGRYILENFSMVVEPGERVGVLGTSGSGKSTLGKLVTGYLPIQEGSVLLDSKPLKPEGYSPIQLIYQHPEKAFNPLWSMERSLKEALSEEEIQVLKKDLMIQDEWLARFPRTLSGGELQRFSIARALSKHTRFIVADEISTMLDVISQAYIWNLLLEETEKRNIGMVVITHNEALAARVCHRVIHI